MLVQEEMDAKEGFSDQEQRDRQKAAASPVDLPTPAKAIRKHCLWCCNDQAAEVRLCPDDECSLWPWRIGSREFAPQGTLSRLRSIRGRCLACAGSAAQVRECAFEDCPLYLYRFGKTVGRKPVSNEHRERGRQMGLRRQAALRNEVRRGI